MASLRGLVQRVRQLFRKPPVGEIPKQWLRPFLPENPVIVDCGAHYGFDSEEFSRLWPRGRVYSFEALPSVYAKLHGRVGALPNVRTFPLALGDKDGTAQFHVSEGGGDRPDSDVDQSSSLLPPDEILKLHPHIRFQRTIEVPVLTLDTWAARENVPRVDLLWLDMQGFEGRFLAASARMLPGVRAIHAEVNRLSNYAGVMLYPELRAWLEAHGFVVVREEMPWADGGNVVFVRREFVPPNFTLPTSKSAG